VLAYTIFFRLVPKAVTPVPQLGLSEIELKSEIRTLQSALRVRRSPLMPAPAIAISPPHCRPYAFDPAKRPVCTAFPLVGRLHARRTQRYAGYSHRQTTAGSRHRAWTGSGRR
jgi:hypothetical protein